MASRGLRKTYFFHLKACERRNFDFCVFLRMCSMSDIVRNRFEISHVTPGQRQEFRCRPTLELGFISQWLLIIHIFVHLSLFLISVQEVFDPFYKLPYKLDQDFCDTRHLLFTFFCHENYSLFQSDNGHFISRLVILFLYIFFFKFWRWKKKWFRVF